MVLLDGRTLAGRRESRIRERADRVRGVRGRAPTLVLIAFADRNGEVPHVRAKLGACARAGVRVVPAIIDADDDTYVAVAEVTEAIGRAEADGVFLQVPVLPHIDEAALIALIPPVADVDIMTQDRTRAYLNGTDHDAPVTVEAALLLLDEYGVDVGGRAGVLVAPETDYAAMMLAALGRRGARLAPITPTAPGLGMRIADADLVAVAAARPGIVRSDMLRPGCIALDFGYFNPDGRGDIDTSAGAGHLAALMPVPGGVGPMTISALVERVVSFAER